MDSVLGHPGGALFLVALFAAACVGLTVRIRDRRSWGGRAPLVAAPVLDRENVHCLEAIARAAGPGRRVLFDLPLDRFLCPASRAGRRALRPLRADFLVVDEGGRPLLVLDRRVSGSFGAPRNDRRGDACDEAALARLELTPDQTLFEIERRTRQALGEPVRPEPVAGLALMSAHLGSCWG